MTVTTFFWFDSQAEEAATRYTEIVPNSRVVEVTRHPDGSAFIVAIELDGQSYTLMNGGPGHPLTDAASVQLIVDTQAEVDRLWEALVEGGEPGPCGWLTDRYGLSWQVAPAALAKMMGADPAKTAAVATALRSMSKIDLQTLQDAYDQA
ncbi:VOC family protein [Nocardia sp. NBC_01009]|uniref:VOC family protein n=1 Tax=Nocardia sp. NBC_01009 TaxID=2975996 RepID=UPI00386ADBEC|nr:VOC family protein [Nocardia sp. NBC_01009]